MVTITLISDSRDNEELEAESVQLSIDGTLQDENGRLIAELNSSGLWVAFGRAFTDITIVAGVS